MKGGHQRTNTDVNTYLLQDERVDGLHLQESGRRRLRQRKGWRKAANTQGKGGESAAIAISGTVRRRKGSESAREGGEKAVKAQRKAAKGGANGRKASTKRKESQHKTQGKPAQNARKWRRSQAGSSAHPETDRDGRPARAAGGDDRVLEEGHVLAYSRGRHSP